MGLFKYLIERDNKKALKKIDKIVQQIEALEDKYKSMTDDELRNTTSVLKGRLQNGETLDDILPDAYALVREASDRVLHMRHFRVQLIGGVALHQGRIAEMKTGEGKTLVATLPAYLNALTGQGVHIVTVNDYLAKTQAEIMSKLYTFLGLTVGILLSQMHPDARKKVYNCDIVYGVNHEFGFDYLRDNMVKSKLHRVQREHNFVIVDEIDSVLIDEARMPLIISGKGIKSSETYVTADKFAKSLKEEDFVLNEKEKTIILTETGIAKAERFFKIDDISDIKYIELNHHINNALRANYIMKKDRVYMVENGEILIVDEFTGRAMPGRRFSEGLHQAIEAKEGLEIKNESKTQAITTQQNYFKIYKKMSGMTGTAKTEEEEFIKIYGLDVVCVPTNKPVIRKDRPDILYKLKDAKLEAIAEEVEKQHEKGRPILIGTITIEKSEELSHLLKKKKIKHTVLNAKNHALEADIIAQAGRLGAVTIATNMAGRGTDIMLGGNPDYLATQILKQRGYTFEEINLANTYNVEKDERIQNLEKEYKKLYETNKVTCELEKEKVVSLGGLLIIGTERHESRRIDNQLRGRAGRQGDPGESVFYISFEDDLLKHIGKEDDTLGSRLMRMSNFIGMPNDLPIQNKAISNLVERAQKSVEANHFGERRYLLQYDNVMSAQRTNIYSQRNEVLEGTDIHEQVIEMVAGTTESVVYSHISDDEPYFKWDLEELNTALEDFILPKGTNLVTSEYVDDLNAEELKDKIVEYVLQNLEQRKQEATEIGVKYEEFERMVMLIVVDKMWMDHIDAMDILKREVGIKRYSQQDPIQFYKKQGSFMFDLMIENIWNDVTKYILNTKIEVAKPKQMEAKHIPVSNPKEVSRNALCPCGSGKKYKNCCGRVC